MPAPERARDPFMDKPSRPRATYADLREVPDHLVAEILDGEVFASPRPASPHGHAQSSILIDLGAGFRGPGRGGIGPGGWWLLVEPELHLGGDVLVPDVAGWRCERMPALPNVAAFTLAPDWICEVVSPSTGRIDRAKKLPIYAREQVRHLWLVDPLAHTLESYRLEGSRWLLLATFSGDDVVRAEPFDAVELSLAPWWLPESEGKTP